MTKLEEKMQRLINTMSERREQSHSLIKAKHKCQKCNDTGWIPVDQDGLEVFKECECRTKRIQESRLRFANLPDAFKDMRLENFGLSKYSTEISKSTIKVACDVIKNYLADFENQHSEGNGLYLYSQTKGSGKTRMAVSIANELLKQGYQIKFSTSTEILNEIKRTWDKDNDYTEAKLLDQIKDCDILIIDDFGTEKVSPWINDRFYQIVNSRYTERRVTIYTSNDSLDKLSYDDRITNRIMEKSYEVQFPEESIREKIFKEKNDRMINRIAKG